MRLFIIYQSEINLTLQLLHMRLEIDVCKV